MIFEDLRNGRFYNEDCFDAMKEIPDGVIDMILCDLPYGTTYADWDKELDIDAIFKQYERILKPKSAIVLTAINPFSALTINKRIKEFRYSWVWNKEHASNFANAKIQPLKSHEDILIFGFQSPVYYPIKTKGAKNHSQGNLNNKSQSDTRLMTGRVEDDTSGMKYPKSILNFPKHSSQVGLHPTQKPTDLFEYLIKTYTNENEIVLDNCAGSGTTAIAAINTNRKWVCIEQRKDYYDIAKGRIQNHGWK